MKRVIFSHYIKLDDSFKTRQFELFKDKIIKKHKEYANICNADYILFEIENNGYDDLQFQKIFKMEELANSYDEILYLDFDVIPLTNENFFDAFDLDTICAYSFSRFPEDYVDVEIVNGIPIYYKQQMKKWLLNDAFDKQSIYVKAACANSMCYIAENGYDEEFKLINTGVIGASSNIIKELNFSGNMEETEEIFEEAKCFNKFDINVNKYFFRNNEAFFTYLVNSKEIPFTNIGASWNRIIDKNFNEIHKDDKFIHHIDKKFEKSL